MENQLSGRGVVSIFSVTLSKPIALSSNVATKCTSPADYAPAYLTAKPRGSRPLIALTNTMLLASRCFVACRYFASGFNPYQAQSVAL